MLEERQIGSLELKECLAEDPFGSVHRGVEWIETRKTREVMVRCYHKAWLGLGLSTRQHEVRRNLVHLGHLKPYKGCHASRDGSPHLVWPLTQGRNLAQVMQAAELQGMPFGIDQALFLVWALSHHIRHLHQVELSPGILTPHRIWIGFDGWVQLLDVPVIGILQELLPAMPETRRAVQSYLGGPASKGLDQDAFQLGALLFEMLTHRPLPPAQELGTALRKARMGVPGGSLDAIPESIVCLLDRLLGRATSFQTLEELERTMEDSVFGGDFEPSTFGLAFAMQTLFRHEISQSQNKEVADPDPPIMAQASERGPVKPEASRPRFRRTARWAAAGLIGGTLAWFGNQAFTRTSTYEPVPGKRASAAITPVLSPSPTPLPLPAPAEPAPGALAPRTPVSAPPHAPSGQPVKLRVFVDEKGFVRQVHVLTGAAEGSERERAACEAAMKRRLAPSQPDGQAVRTWEEITVMVP